MRRRRGRASTHLALNAENSDFARRGHPAANRNLPPRSGLLERLLALAIAWTTLGCSAAPRPGERLERAGDEIVVCGEFFHTGTPVRLWLDPGGYDAYRSHRRFSPGESGPVEAPDRNARYGSFRRGAPAEIDERVADRGWRLEDLREVVEQVVVHFDACGTSRRCFEVLHDIRGLSSHFLIDLDGTVYQTLDVKERAWHAAQANDRSIGIEIAHIGAYTDTAILDRWYIEDEQRGAGQRRLVIPAEHGETGLPPDFTDVPARPGLHRGTINGRSLVQYDFTERQYLALEKLIAALCRVLPRIRADVPRDADGSVRQAAFENDEQLHAWAGLVGHWHITAEKVDPGPAFDWDRLIRALERESPQSEED
jgi:N-acetylmuramoyl-L-alanine amidase